MPDNSESVRLDKWLWAARFYKTRQLANDAVSGGKVHSNGQRCKPSKTVSVGDILSIHKNSYFWEITITLLTTRRRSAKEAILMYQESEDSHAKRQEQIWLEREQKQLLNITVPSHRPNKRDRRLIHRFKQLE